MGHYILYYLDKTNLCFFKFRRDPKITYANEEAASGVLAAALDEANK